MASCLVLCLTVSIPDYVTSPIKRSLRRWDYPHYVPLLVAYHVHGMRQEKRLRERSCVVTYHLAGGHASKVPVRVVGACDGGVGGLAREACGRAPGVSRGGGGATGTHHGGRCSAGTWPTSCGHTPVLKHTTQTIRSTANITLPTYLSFINVLW
jgi:hypothetical protein